MPCNQIFRLTKAEEGQYIYSIVFFAPCFETDGLLEIHLSKTTKGTDGFDVIRDYLKIDLELFEQVLDHIETYTGEESFDLNFYANDWRGRNPPRGPIVEKVIRNDRNPAFGIRLCEIVQRTASEVPHFMAIMRLQLEEVATIIEKKAELIQVKTRGFTNDDCRCQIATPFFQKECERRSHMRLGSSRRLYRTGEL